MLKRLRSAHPILFCILAEVLLLGTLFVTDLVFSVVLLFAGVDFTTMDTYLYSTLQELAGAAVMVLVLKKTGRAGILFRRGSGFFNGLLVGMYPLVLIGYSFFASLMFQRPENTPLLPLGRILTFLLSMMMVGVAEEFAFRGVIAQTLLEHYGTSRGGIWKACIVSGLLFGAAHLTNILGSAPFGVLMQCLFAAALGTLFAAIYFRTGNIWVTVFLHGMMDISSMLIGGLYGTTTLAESVSGYDLSMLYSVALYLIPMAFLLRKKKLPEVQLYWGGCVKK
jgi:membrane protease YdiL (CAAX protease family)